MKILITGANGFIGKNLTVFLKNDEHIITAITRSDIKQDSKFLSEKFEGTDVVINLAGAPILRRWTTNYKKIIYESRINTTKNIVQAINLCETKPGLFISASAIGIYNNTGIHNEESTSFSKNFLGTVCKDWETETQKAICSRIVILRIGVVLDATGGAFPKMYLPFKISLGGKIGNGAQSFSFIHLHDFLSALKFIIENKTINGIVNMVAPESITNKEFTKLLAFFLNKPAFFIVPAFILKILYGDGASILLEGQNAVPEKLLKAGFDFRFKTFGETLKELLK